MRFGARPSSIRWTRCIPLIALITPLFVYLTPLFGAKGYLSVRGDVGGYADVTHDRPYHVVALVEGRCRDVSLPKADTRNLYYLYRLEKVEGREKPKSFGVVYTDEGGKEQVCFSDLAVEPFVDKNVVGSMVSITGTITMGRDYNIDKEEIVIVNSAEVIDNIP